MTELEKWDKVYQDFNTIRNFLSEAPEGVMLGRVNDTGIKDCQVYDPLCSSDIDKVLYEYFDIDYNKLDMERRELLERARHG